MVGRLADEPGNTECSLCFLRLLICVAVIAPTGKNGRLTSERVQPEDFFMSYHDMPSTHPPKIATNGEERRYGYNRA